MSQKEDILQRYVKESPRVAEAYANVLACKGDRNNRELAVRELTAAICATHMRSPTATTPTTTTTATTTTNNNNNDLQNKVKVVNGLVVKIRNMRIADRALFDALRELRGASRVDAALSTKMTTAIVDVHVAISAINTSIEALLRVTDPSKEDHNNATTAKLIVDATYALAKTITFVEAAETFFLKKRAELAAAPVSFENDT